MEWGPFYMIGYCIASRAQYSPGVLLRSPRAFDQSLNDILNPSCTERGHDNNLRLFGTKKRFNATPSIFLMHFL